MMNVRVETDTALNRALTAGFLLLQILQLLLIPVVLLPRSESWGWLLAIPLLLSNSWWAFIHEAIHDHLFSNRRIGRIAGRINGILYGVAFDLLRVGHLLHHAYSRTRRERSEVYTAGEDSWLAAAAGHYFRLLGGLYAFEVIGTLVFLLPRSAITRLEARIASDDNVVEGLTHRLTSPDTLAAVRIDTLAILSVYGMSFYCYGQHWWMLALVLWGRGLLISLMDNAFHYGTPLDQPRHARNLSAPTWCRRLLLNFNLHGLHHRQPNLPWHALAHYRRNGAEALQGNLFLTVLSQFRGPISEQKLLDASRMQADTPRG